MNALRAGPEDGAAPALMLGYQKSHRRRTVLGPRPQKRLIRKRG